MSDEVMVLIISGVLAAVVAGVVAYFQSKRVEASIGKVVDELLENSEWMDTLEAQFDENIPDEVQDIIMAFLVLAERMSGGTATELDNKLVDLLKQLFDDSPEA